MKKLLSSVIMLMLVVGCGTKSDETKIAIIGENAANIQSMMALEKEYEALRPNVDLDFKPNSFDDAFNKANQDFANGTALYDIIMQYNFSLSSFVNNEYVYPIDDLLKNVPDSLMAFENDMFPNSWKEVGYYYKKGTNDDNETVKVGYPFASNTMLLAYNKALFDDEQQKAAFRQKYNTELQVPQTWEDLVTVAEFFTQPTSGTYGICLQGAGGGWLYYEWMNFLYGMGGKIMDKEHGWQGDKNTGLELNTPEALAAIQLYKSLKPFNAGNFSNVDQAEQIRIFQQGKTAMAIVWTDMIYPSFSQDGKFGNRVGFATVPGSKSILAGGAYFVNAKTRSPEEVANYLIYLMQPETQIALAKKGNCSALKTVYEDPEVKQLPYSQAVYNSLQRGGVVLEAGPDANMIAEKVTTYIQLYWDDKLTAEQALTQMQTEIMTERANIFAALR